MGIYVYLHYKHKYLFKIHLSKHSIAIVFHGTQFAILPILAFVIAIIIFANYLVPVVIMPEYKWTMNFQKSRLKKTFDADFLFSMRDRKSLFSLIAIMTLVVMVAGSVGIFVLYNAAFEQQRARLVEAVESQARLVESVTRVNASAATAFADAETRAATLQHISAAYERLHQLDDSSQYILAERRGDDIVFLLDHPKTALPRRVPFHSAHAEPLRRALQGGSGTMVTVDYRGNDVLAAYENIEGLSWAITAKIDLARIRAPFIRAGIVATIAALAMIFVGAFLFMRITNPLIRRLVESETKTRTIVETAVDGIITIDARGRIQSLNPAAERIFGYHAEEAIGKNIKLFIPSPHREQHDDYIKRYIETGERQIIGIGREVLGRRKNGEVFPMHLSVSEFFINSERMFTGIVQDVSKRKRAEEALAESQRSLATLMSNLPGMVYRCRNDENWTMEFVSEGAYALTGYQPDDLVENKNVIYNKLIFQEDEPVVRAQVKKALQQRQPFRVIYRIKTASGRTRWMWEQGRGVYNNGLAHTLEGFITDITDRVKAEHSLQASEARTRAVFETAVDGIIIINDSGIIESANSAVKKLFGYAPDEVIGKNVSILMPEPYRSKHDHYINEYLRTGQKKIIGIGREVVGLRKDGSTFPIHLSVSEFSFGDKRMFTGLIHDITEQKSLQQRILQSERLAVIGKMAAKVAHEVRNPLSSISLNAELLEEEFDGLDECNTEEARALLTAMINEIDRVTSLTDEYLQFSRMPDSSPVRGDLNALLRELLQMSAAELQQKNIKLETEGLEDELELRFDRAQIRRVFFNLIRNAMEAMPTGGKLHVSSNRNGHTATIAIRDTGTGIPEELVDNIFSPFFTTKDFGTGLGLAISQQVVNEHHGQIYCESKVDQGTVFRIELPLEESKARIEE